MGHPSVPHLRALRGPFDFAQGRLLKRRSSTVLQRAARAPGKSRSRSKAADRSVRSTRAGPMRHAWTRALPGFS